MSTEEKAKRYDETLEQARKELNTCGSLDCDAARQILRFFPQLRESEDERIRKTLIDALKASKSVGELKFVFPEPTRKDCIAYLEKQKEQKPIETTICGQDYKCKKDYKTSTCKYIKDAIYHCSRDGYLNDQNGVSWSCPPEWFNEYIQSNTEWAEEEKTRFVSGQFLQCKLSFDEFKEGEHYWLEYVGNDMYVGRSDNILNQKFHITPRQLYTLFSQQLEEVQGSPQEEKQVSLNYEPPFDENPSDKEIIEALIHHLSEQDGFLTAINCISTKAILGWLRKQKEQKPAEYKATINGEPIATENQSVNIPLTEWSDEDSDNLERVDNYLWMLDNYVGDDCAIPQGKTDKIRGNIQEVLSPWLKSLPERFNLQSKQEWSEEDEDFINMLILHFNYLIEKGGDSVETYKSYINKLKSLRPQYHGDVTMTEAYKMGLEAGKASSWKPSEEQMEELQSAITFMAIHNMKVDSLVSLHKELKKLYNQ